MNNKAAAHMYVLNDYSCTIVKIAQYLKMNGQHLTKFCTQIFIDKIYVRIVKGNFSQICNRVMALD